MTPGRVRRKKGNQTSPYMYVLFEQTNVKALWPLVFTPLGAYIDVCELAEYGANS